MTKKTEPTWILTDGEEDACTPTPEQIEAYLAEPDDKIAKELDRKLKRHAAISILYGRNCARAQLKKIYEEGNKLCDGHAGIVDLDGHIRRRHECPWCWQELGKEVGE